MDKLGEKEKEILRCAEKVRDYCHERTCENCFLHKENDFGDISTCTFCNVPMHWNISEIWKYEIFS